MRKRYAVFLSLAILGTPDAEAEEDFNSGNSYLEPCRKAALAEHIRADIFEAMKIGYCMGTVETILSVSPSVGVCAPKGATNSQAIRVVTRYLDQHPEKTNEDFRFLTRDALTEAWPCRNRR
ncbi:Rap1a/Tai family immunity protein [Methylocystis sp. IM2]|uniref:Rap1a/Tai family immunity protein n=1 Tax=unclassified Methylocystis TaxID=2625913 RepID=UPI0040474B7E